MLSSSFCFCAAFSFSDLSFLTFSSFFFSFFFDLSSAFATLRSAFAASLVVSPAPLSFSFCFSTYL